MNKILCKTLHDSDNIALVLSTLGNTIQHWISSVLGLVTQGGKGK